MHKEQGPRPLLYVGFNFFLPIHNAHVYTYIRDIMKIRNLANQITQLIERELGTSRPGVTPSHVDLVDLLGTWGVMTNHSAMRLESDMLGAGDTIYVKFGPMYFALLQNWDACLDGINRFLMVIPLYGEWDGQKYIHGLREMPIEIAADALERLVSILVDIHNTTL